MAKLYLVRHGLAAERDDLRLPGPDHGLRPEGWEQARTLAERLRPLAPTAVYASDALRSRQTAEMIAATCGVALTVDARLQEVDFGVWSGKTFAEIVAVEPAAEAYFRDPTCGMPPSGEPARDAAERVLTVLHTLGQGGGGVVVGHAGSLRLALALALGMPLAAYWRLRLECAHLSVLDWTEEGVVVELLNDGCHLR